MGYNEIASEKAKKLIKSGHALILSVESSCDETAIAIVRDGREVLADEIASQVDIHALYGGVVPTAFVMPSFTTSFIARTVGLSCAALQN